MAFGPQPKRRGGRQGGGGPQQMRETGDRLAKSGPPGHLDDFTNGIQGSSATQGGAGGWSPSIARVAAPLQAPRQAAEASTPRRLFGLFIEEHAGDQPAVVVAPNGPAGGAEVATNHLFKPQNALKARPDYSRILSGRRCYWPDAGKG